MVEKSFVASAKCSIDFLPVDGEFKEIGEDLLESEQLIDTIYRTYIPLISRGGWRDIGGKTIDISDLGEAYRGGFYLPCCKRVVFTGQVDLMNDRLSDHAGVVFHTKEFSPTFLSVRRAKPPEGIAQFPHSTAYAATSLFDPDVRDRRERRSTPGALSAWGFWFSVMRDGRVLPLFDLSTGYVGDFSSVRAASCQAAVVALNLDADSHHLWTVRTEEHLFNAIKTPLRLGVSESHVKSLFYARQMPVTESGRKRPILHWVAAHNRRLKEGIEIDVSRHLRGVERFEMEGFSFEITNPRKKAK